jgi:hypothetical protein
MCRGHHQPIRAGRQRQVALVVLCPCALTDGLDMTVVNLALPFALVFGVLSMRSAATVARFGERAAIATGLFVCAIGMALLGAFVHAATLASVLATGRRGDPVGSAPCRWQRGLRVRRRRASRLLGHRVRGPRCRGLGMVRPARSPTVGLRDQRVARRGGASASSSGVHR